jgi:hypothetical protein
MSYFLTFGHNKTFELGQGNNKGLSCTNIKVMKYIPKKNNKIILVHNKGFKAYNKSN